MPRQVVGSVTPDAKGQPALQALNRELVRIWQAINALQGNSGKVTTATGQVIDGDLKINGQLNIGTDEKAGLINIGVPGGDRPISSLIDPYSQALGQQCTELQILSKQPITFYASGDSMPSGAPNPTPVASILGIVRPSTPWTQYPIGDVVPQAYDAVGAMEYNPVFSGGTYLYTTEVTLGYPGIANATATAIGFTPERMKTVFNESTPTVAQMPYGATREVGHIHMFGVTDHSLTTKAHRGITTTGTIDSIPSWIGFRVSAISAGAGFYDFDNFWPLNTTWYALYAGEQIVTDNYPPGTSITFAQPGVYRVNFWTRNTGAGGMFINLQYNPGGAGANQTVQRQAVASGQGGTLNALVLVSYADFQNTPAPFIQVEQETIGFQRYGHATNEETGIIIQKIGGIKDDPNR